MRMGIKMKTLVIKYWWTLIAFMAFVMIILLILVMSAPATVFETILGILLLMTLIALPVSWIVLLINKQWRKCLLSFILSIVTIFVLGGMLSFAAMWGPGYDNFGKKHPIPDGLKYNIPMDRDSIAITLKYSCDAMRRQRISHFPKTGSQKEAKSLLILPLRFHNLYTIRALPSTKVIGRIITLLESKYGSKTKRQKKSVNFWKRFIGSTAGCGEHIQR